MRRILSACLIVLAFGTPKPAWSQSAGVLGELFESATYEASGYSAYYPMDISRADADDDTIGLAGRLIVTSQAAVTDNLMFRIKAFGDFSNSDGDHGGVFSGPNQTSTRARYVDFTRLSLNYQADNFSITLGKSELSNGVSTLFSPADRFETSYAANPMHAFKTGVWQAKLDVPVEDDTLTIAVLPYDNRSFVPNRKSRWVGTSGSYLFSGLDIGAGNQLDEPFRDSDPENWGYFLKYKGARSGYDFFASAHHGPSSYPVVYRPNFIGSYEVLHPMASTLAGGIAATIERWEVHGEASYQATMHNHDHDFGKYVAGASYRDTDFAGIFGWEEIQPVIEYAGEWITSHKLHSAISASSINARPYRDALLVRVEMRFSDEWRFVVGGSKNLVDRDSSAVASLEYKHTDNLTFRFDARHFDGESDTQFGRWRRNDHFELSVVWKF